MEEKTKLLQLLAEQAYQYRAVPFTLSAGGQSHEYLDCRAALSNPETLAIAASLLLVKLDPTVVAVGGLTMGADPLAIALSLCSHDAYEHSNYGAPSRVKWFSVRKEPKGHGTTRLIEGSVKPGDRVAVLDDVATSGASTIRAIKACREFGLTVVQAIVLIDRGGLDNIRDFFSVQPYGSPPPQSVGQGVRVDAVCQLSEIRVSKIASST